MFENIFVLIDYNTRYAQAFPIRNQRTNTAGTHFYDNFAVYYGFPAKFHNKQVANFKSRLKSDWDEGSPYNAISPNEEWYSEEVKRTLLNMFGALEESQ